MVLNEFEAENKQGSGHQANRQCSYRMHQIRTGADRDQPRQCAVMDKSRVVASGNQCSKQAANHGQQ